MIEILAACGIMVFSGVASLLAGRRNGVASAVAAGGVWTGCLLATRPVITSVMGGTVLPSAFDWTLPLGRFAVGLDALSAFFCLPVLILAPLAALHGSAYLAHHSRPLGMSWLSYNTLIASMLLVMTARDGILFIMAWELMAIASFVLVVFDHEDAQVRRAGWIYLAATHIGASALLVFFAVLGGCSGGFGFDQLRNCASHMTPVTSGVLFCLALVGFGSKAGIFPLHVWLPEAHPAAPSHVSAVMSGVMIKTGVYGLMRAILILDPPPAYIGWVMISAGAVSGVLGVVFALAQHDVKRLLAYSSVENIGIIILGFGAGLLGMAWDIPALTVAGFAGSLLHVLNHAVFKGLLFLSAGTVFHHTGARIMDRLGGLIKPMRATGICFLTGAAAISGLPPFNGFISEFLIYTGGIDACHAPHTGGLLLAAALIGALALIGGLGAACFAKCGGLMFLGEPRTQEAAGPFRTAPAMIAAMSTLAALSLALGLTAPWLVQGVMPAVSVLTGSPSASMPVPVGIVTVMQTISLTGLSVIVLAVILRVIHRILIKHRPSSVTVTWDCGYARPTPRMQYTTASFAQPLIRLFQPLLRPVQSQTPVSGFFPESAGLEEEFPDTALNVLFTPLFRWVAAALKPLRNLQNGRIHVYILYVALTLLALLIWKAGF